MACAVKWRGSVDARWRPPLTPMLAEVGVLVLEHDVMELVQHPGLVLIAYSAVPGTPAADGLALLASLAATNGDAMTAPGG